MFDEGLIITLVGMSGVFIFLILLVFSMSIMSRIIQKISPENKTVLPTKTKASPEIAIAIAIAGIKHYTSKENN